MRAAYVLLLFCGVIAVPLAFLAVSIDQFRKSGTTGRIVWGSVAGLSSIPVLALSALLIGLIAANFPFTSGVIAHSFNPNGDEACIVQTFTGAEYRVSLYARHAGQAWIWNYLAHEDDRWCDCRMEFSGDELRIYTGSTLRKAISVAEATAPKQLEYQMPADYSPDQILARQNAQSQ